MATQMDTWRYRWMSGIRRGAWRYRGMHGDMEGCMEAWVDMWGQRDVWRYEGKHGDTEGDMEEAWNIEQANMK